MTLMKNVKLSWHFHLSQISLKNQKNIWTIARSCLLIHNFFDTYGRILQHQDDYREVFTEKIPRSDIVKMHVTISCLTHIYTMGIRGIEFSNF